MGPKRRRAPRPGSSPDFVALRRLTTVDDPDLVTFRAVLDRVSTGARFRLAEGPIYTAACARYSELTGEAYGIKQGDY